MKKSYIVSRSFPIRTKVTETAAREAVFYRTLNNFKYSLMWSNQIFVVTTNLSKQFQTAFLSEAFILITN